VDSPRDGGRVAKKGLSSTRAKIAMQIEIKRFEMCDASLAGNVLL
jgi:hypothetical protein